MTHAGVLSWNYFQIAEKRPSPGDEELQAVHSLCA